MAELAARRRGTHATKTRGMVRGGGAKPWRQKGTGRARAGSLALPAVDRRRHGLRPEPAPLHGQGQPQGAPGRAALRALAPRRARLAVRSRRRRLRRAVDQAGGRACWPSAAAAPCSSCSAPRRGAAAQVVPQPRGRDRARRRERGRGRHRRRRDARRLAGAIDALTARRRADAAGSRRPRRRRPDGPQPGHHPPRRLREVLRPRDGRQVHVPRPHGRAQDADQAGRRGAVRRQGARGPHLRGAVQAQAPRLHRRAARASGRRRSCRCARATRSRSSRAWRPISDADPQAQAHVARPALRHLRGLRGDHEDRAREVARRGPQEVGRPQRQRPQDRPPPRRRRQAPVPHDRLQARARTASPPASPRSSTTPTGRPTSRCCTTSTARRPTSSRRTACASA